MTTTALATLIQDTPIATETATITILARRATTAATHMETAIMVNSFDNASAGRPRETPEKVQS